MGPDLKRVDKLIRKANAKIESGDMVESKKLATEAGEALKKLEGKDDSYFFFLLKARYSLLENEKSANGLSPSDQRGLTFVRQAKTKIPEGKSEDEKILLNKEFGMLEARLLLRMNDATQALPLLEQLWKTDSSMRHTALMLSETYFKLATFEPKQEEPHLIKALKFADQSILLSKVIRSKLDGDGKKIDYDVYVFPSGYNQRARVRMRQGAFLDAKLDLVTAIEQQPRFRVAHFNHGVCLAMLATTHEKDSKNPKKYADYRTELLQVINTLRTLDPSLADKLYGEYYFKSIRDWVLFF